MRGASPSRPRASRRQALRGLALVALWGLPLACSGESAEVGTGDGGELEKPVPVVTTHPVEVSLDDVFLEREATLTAVATAQISTRQEGFVRDVGPELGDLLHAGDFIAQIDETDVRLQLAEAQAEVRRARATLAEQERAWKRARELFAGEVLSRGELDDREAALQRARAEVEELTAAASRTRVELEGMRILAPMDGAITQLYTEAGEYLERGDRVAELKRIDSIVALCTVSERYLADVHEGSSVYVHVTAYPGRTFQGLVWKIIPSALLESRSFPVKVLLGNPDLALKPGMSARVSFVRRVEGGLLVPKDAVLREGDRAYVFVVEHGQAVPRDVVLGRPIRDQWHVRSGLSVKDGVVVTGNEDLTAGATVEVVELPPPGPPTIPTLKAAEEAPAAGS